MCNANYNHWGCLEFAHYPGPQMSVDESTSRSIRCQKCGNWALTGSRFCANREYLGVVKALGVQDNLNKADSFCSDQQ